ncbi:MAG TPA: CheR family methyltransferase [Candidatus Polarisedimenticolia bacterium]
MRAPLDHDDLERFKGILGASLGLSFDDSKTQELADALSARVRATRSSGASSYLTHLESREKSKEELRALASLLSVGETSFFRYPAHFRALAEVALPARMKAREEDRALRVLSAGCASGEEAYSIAILLSEQIGDADPWRVTIEAIDFNPDAIRRARDGRYASWSLRETPPEILGRCFAPSGGSFLLEPRIREMVSFEERNLLDDGPAFWRPESFDIILCRNVIIYFSPEAIQTVISRLSRSLAIGGYLFMGHSETLRGLSNDFHLVHTHDAFYYQKRQATAVVGIPAADSVLTRASFPRPASPEPDVEDWPGGGPVAPVGGAANAGGHRAKEIPVSPAPSPDLSRATEMFRQERYGEALDLLRATPAETGADPDALLLVAASLAGGGELEESERICRQVLALDEMDAGAHYLLALCREQAGDMAGARHHSGAAAYLDPTFAMPHLQLGRLARRAGQVEAARRELGRALHLLAREDASRILLFGGGFRRAALAQACQSELRACGGPP